MYLSALVNEQNRKRRKNVEMFNVWKNKFNETVHEASEAGICYSTPLWLHSFYTSVSVVGKLSHVNKRAHAIKISVDYSHALFVLKNALNFVLSWQF